jgi:hypothetical protein
MAKKLKTCVGTYVNMFTDDYSSKANDIFDIYVLGIESDEGDVEVIRIIETCIETGFNQFEKEYGYEKLKRTCNNLEKDFAPIYASFKIKDLIESELDKANVEYVKVFVSMN